MWKFNGPLLEIFSQDHSINITSFNNLYHLNAHLFLDKSIFVVTDEYTHIENHHYLENCDLFFFLPSLTEFNSGI